MASTTATTTMKIKNVALVREIAHVWPAFGAASSFILLATGAGAPLVEPARFWALVLGLVRRMPAAKPCVPAKIVECDHFGRHSEIISHTNESTGRLSAGQQPASSGRLELSGCWRPGGR